VSHVVSLVVGAAVGLASLAVHRSGPVWVTLAVGASLGTAGWLLADRPSRLAASYALGWLVVFGTAVLGRSEGDYVVATDLAGYLMSGTALGLVVLGVLAVGRGRDGSPT
jgi:hypothetical protein